MEQKRKEDRPFLVSLKFAPLPPPSPISVCTVYLRILIDIHVEDPPNSSVFRL